MHSLKLISQNPLENFLKLVGNLKQFNSVLGIFQVFKAMIYPFCIIRTHIFSNNLINRIFFLWHYKPFVLFCLSQDNQ